MTPNTLQAPLQKLRSIDLAGPSGRLEAVLNEGAPDVPFAALICHPHPPSGGTMHHKVVYHAMKVMNAPEWGLRWPVLRFNFRGAGLSEGSYNGRAEAEDVTAAMNWLKQEYGKPIIAAGFSFGAAMMLAACCTTGSAHAAAALGLPIQSRTQTYEYPFLSGCNIPKLFLSGDHDEFAQREQLEALIAKAQEPKRLVFVEQTDHFFTGKIDTMQQELAHWLREQQV